MTPDLCNAILDNQKTFADTANDLKESFEEIETRAIAAYYNFVQDEDDKRSIPNDTPDTMESPLSGSAAQEMTTANSEMA